MSEGATERFDGTPDIHELVAARPSCCERDDRARINWRSIMRVFPRQSLRIALPALAIALALPVLAWTASYERLTLQPESKLWVDGTSTVRSFSCKATDVDATVEGTADAVAQVSAGEKGISAARVRVETSKLDCGNGTMNEHMRKALKADVSPVIDFQLESYDVSRATDGVSGTLSGTLKLGGVQKPISIQAIGKSEQNALRVTGSYPLKMTEYGLKPPTLMFGRIKVGETVTVKFDLLLKS
jgi:polyisoprenoid-binding protein YceI